MVFWSLENPVFRGDVFINESTVVPRAKLHVLCSVTFLLLLQYNSRYLLKPIQDNSNKNPPNQNLKCVEIRKLIDYEQIRCNRTQSILL